MHSKLFRISLWAALSWYHRGQLGQWVFFCLIDFWWVVSTSVWRAHRAAPELSRVDRSPSLSWAVEVRWWLPCPHLTPALRTDCFPINLESPYPLTLLDLLLGGGPLGFVGFFPAPFFLFPPQVQGTCQSHLVFTAILRTYLLWTCSWMKSVLVQ